MSVCCCCCWVTSVVSDSVWPHRWQPTRLPLPWDSPGKNTGVGCHFLLQCMKVKSESKSLSHDWLLVTPWTAAGVLIEGLILKLKLQYFGYLMQRTDSFEKTLVLGKMEGGRRRGWQRIRWLDGITDSTWVWVNSGSWWWTGRPSVLQSMGMQRVGHDWATELNWIQLLLVSL